MTIQDLVKKMHTTPFFFIGAGFSRRYFKLPSWIDLLKHFSNRISGEEFAFQKYRLYAESSLPSNANDGQINAKIASLIADDFNKRWFDDISFRQLPEKYLEFIHKDVSPFKAELAHFIEQQSVLNKEYLDEMKAFSELSEKSISGIITTNFDMLLENLTYQYRTFIGQEELLFSNINYLAEIYKIHGSISDPESIVITDKDYNSFNKNSAYLAAKLMTIFMEYPIIFLGYSISDPNINNILESIVNCLSTKNVSRLQDRFIYVEWDKSQTEMEITNTSKQINNFSIQMTCIRTNSFLELFEVLKDKKISIPVKMLRLFKEAFYSFTISNEPNAHFRVATVDNEAVDDSELVLAITAPYRLGLNGLKGLSRFDYYKHIVLNDIKYSADEILNYACPDLFKSSAIIPVYRLLSEATEPHNFIPKKHMPKKYDEILSNSIKNNRYTRAISHRSIKGILHQYNSDYFKSVKFISYLEEHEICLQELEDFLISEFSRQDLEQYLLKNKPVQSELFRLVRIYDYLKFKNKKRAYIVSI